jgi:hypothetical protein
VGDRTLLTKFLRDERWAPAQWLLATLLKSFGRVHEPLNMKLNLLAFISADQRSKRNCHRSLTLMTANHEVKTVTLTTQEINHG